MTDKFEKSKIFGQVQINNALYIKGLYKGASLVALLHVPVRKIVFADNSECEIALQRTPKGPVLETNRGPLAAESPNHVNSDLF